MMYICSSKTITVAKISKESETTIEFNIKTTDYE